MEKSDAKIQEAGKISAHELLKEFLVKNKISLVIDPLNECVSTTSKGALILDVPKITAKYNE